MAQMFPRLGDVAANLERHRELIARAREQGARLVVFPELSLTGYHLQDLVPDVAERRDGNALGALVREARDIDVVVGFVEETPGHGYYNAAAYLADGAVVHVHRKLFLPTYGLFQEGREFSAGESARTFDAPHGPCALLVCEDLWHAPAPWILAQQGAEMIVVPANGPIRGARPGSGITTIGVWRELVTVTARFQTVFLVFVNRVGVEDGLTFGGGSAVVDPFGHVLAELPPLEDGLATVDLAGESLRRARTASPLVRDARLELVHREVARLRRLRYDIGAATDDEPAADSATELP